MENLLEALNDDNIIIKKVPGNCQAKIGEVVAYGKTPVNALWDLERRLEKKNESKRIASK